MKSISKEKMYLDNKVSEDFMIWWNVALSPRGERVIRVHDEDLSTRFSVSCIVSLDVVSTFIDCREDSNDQVCTAVIFWFYIRRISLILSIRLLKLDIFFWVTLLYVIMPLYMVAQQLWMILKRCSLFLVWNYSICQLTLRNSIQQS